MAQEILNNLLHFKISPKEIIEWLTNDNCNNIQQVDCNELCSKEEFITLFLNYLRDQFRSILQSSNASREIKKNESLENNAELSENNQHIECSLKNIDCSKVQMKNDKLSHQQISFKENQSALIEKNISDINICKNVQVTTIKEDLSDLQKPISIENDMVNLNLASPINSTRTSTPVFKRKNSPKNRRVELISCSPSQNKNINPIFQESFEYKQVNDITDAKDISFDDSSFPSLSGNNSSNLNVSNFSTSINKSKSSDLIHSNLSQKSNHESNKILLSPVSPMYSNPMSMLGNSNMKTPQNKYKNHSNNNSFQQNITCTPERTSNSVSEKSKITSSRNLTLGDFIMTETQSSKKNRAKKNIKILSKNEEQKDSEQQSVVSNISSTISEQNVTRRKVNPTRLNISDEKGNRENAVFGDISRPFTQNPQFVNVSPIDKSVDNASFQVERGLVKIERQKKPESTIDTNNENKTIILQRTPSKIIQSSSIIIPSITLVENREILDALAELYSGLLDYNLVVNPMLELYFIIQLITIQYTTKSKKSPAIKKIENKILEDINDESNMKKNLFTLRKSLNFDNFNEENNLKENIESDIKHNLKYNETYELGCSSLVNDTEENIDDIDKKSEHILIDKIDEEQINNDKEENKIQESDATKNIVMYLNTPHNCVYFSSQVLNHQKDFLKHLDRVTLKLLCKNNQIITFQPELCKYLDTIYSIKVTESNKIKSLLNIGIVELNVCFQIDTDNSEKFSSLIAFHCFRKQRDMFYEILKIWEDNHLVPGWSFQIALNGKIKTMITMHMDITNFTHFARLFKSQMLISCIQSEQQDDSLDDETIGFLKTLKDNNPEKLNKLRKKLVTPLSQNGPVPLPSFPGIQEFYKDFILYASHPTFYAYLEDTFIHEIMELNNSQFSGSEIEEKETEVDECTKQSYAVCLSSLRLLSKFLGFMTSLPYRSEISMLEDVIKSQVILRSSCLPRIDLQHCLQFAINQGKLTLTVPWIVEYLAMMDHASLRLPYFKNILEILYCIYRASNNHAITNSEELMTPTTAVLIKFTIGWLFALPTFPMELYHSWQSKYSDKSLKIISVSHQTRDNINDSKFNADASVVSVNHCLFLDKLEIVDERILYNCCPFLRELNNLLTSGSLNVNNNTPIRHITPVTSQLQKPIKKKNTKHLEIQLEEAFFHGQPMSTRKTVEYVSERVASSCVKYICNNLLTVERQKNYEALKNIIEEKYSEDLENNPHLVKKSLEKEMNLISMEALKNIKEKSEQIIPSICTSRVTQSIESLLAEDCLKAVKDMCIKIAIRMAMERIDQWIQSHIIGSSNFIKDMELELNRAFKTCDTTIIVKKLHNPCAISPSKIIEKIRKIIWDLLEINGTTITVDSLSNLWDQVYQCLTERFDLKLMSMKTILSSSVDLCLFLIVHRNDLFTCEIEKKVFKVWKIEHLKISEPDSPLLRFLSPRNIVIIAHSQQKNVWLDCGKFLKKLLKENILSIDALSDQAVALFRNEWPTPIMKNLSTCLSETIDGFKSSDEETERIRHLLSWVAGAYNDMDLDSFSFY